MGKKISPFPNVSDKEFEEAVIKTYAFTKRKMSHLKKTRLYSIMDYEDITNEAVMKTISGEREWNQNYSLFVHLAWCSRGIISNLKNKLDTKLLKTSDNMDMNQGRVLSPEDIQIIIGDFSSFEEYVLSNRSDLIQLTNAILKDEISKPLELSEHLKISVKEVNSGKVALKRIYTRLYDKIKSD